MTALGLFRHSNSKLPCRKIAGDFVAEIGLPRINGLVHGQVQSVDFHALRRCDVNLKENVAVDAEFFAAYIRFILVNPENLSADDEALYKQLSEKHKK